MQKDFVTEILSERAGSALNSSISYAMLAQFAVLVCIYGLSLVVPASVFVELSSDPMSQKMRELLPLDYYRFLRLADRAIASRVWVIEILTVMTATAFTIFVIVMTVRVFSTEQLAIEKMLDRSIVTRWTVGNLLAMLTVPLIHYSFIGEEVINGDLGYAPGPNDGAVGFFVLVVIGTSLFSGGVGYLVTWCLARLRLIG